jgi:hypothetical protein
VAYAVVRETHDADLAAGAQTKIQHSFSYSDGFGRDPEEGPGRAWAGATRDLHGRIIVNGQPAHGGRRAALGRKRWTVFNKGNPSASSSRSSPTPTVSTSTSASA